MNDDYNTITGSSTAVDINKLLLLSLCYVSSKRLPQRDEIEVGVVKKQEYL